MKLSELSIEQLESHLSADGIYLYTGPFVNRIQTRIPSVIQNLHRLYQSNKLSLEPVFADFHIYLEAAKGIRRWLKPQVFFYLDEKIPFKPLPYDQAYPMLEWGMNWCISNYAHQYLILHAAVVEKNDQAIILPARPGAGKSTLTAGLISHGWRLLSDELAIINLDSLELLALGRPVNLKNESIKIMKQIAVGSLFSEEVCDTNKGTVALMQAPESSVKNIGKQVKAAYIIIPEYVKNAPVQIDKINKAEAFMHVADNAFNYSLQGGSGFETVAKMIDETETYKFSYSQIDDAVKTFDALVN